MDCGFAEDSPQPPTAAAPFKEGSWKPSKSQMDELGLVWLEVGAHRIQNHEPAVFGQRVELVDLVLEQAHARLVSAPHRLTMMETLYSM